MGSDSAGHLEALQGRMTRESNITSSISQLPDCERRYRLTVFCHCNDLLSATPSTPLTPSPPCEQLLLSRVFAPNTVTPGLFPEQMKVDTLNLIPGEISPRLARGPVFKSGWRMESHREITVDLFCFLKWSLEFLNILSRFHVLMEEYISYSCSERNGLAHKNH